MSATARKRATLTKQFNLLRGRDDCTRTELTPLLDALKDATKDVRFAGARYLTALARRRTTAQDVVLELMRTASPRARTALVVALVLEDPNVEFLTSFLDRALSDPAPSIRGLGARRIDDASLFSLAPRLAECAARETDPETRAEMVQRHQLLTVGYVLGEVSPTGVFWLRTSSPFELTSSACHMNEVGDRTRDEWAQKKLAHTPRMQAIRRAREPG